jgi:hypothetical protein
MIKKVYILKSTGHLVYFLDCCLFQTKSEKKTEYLCDPDLISGFFAAIIAFAENTSGQKAPLNQISMRNHNYYFFHKIGFYFILETDINNSSLKYEDFINLLKCISENFHNAFSFQKDSVIIQRIEDNTFTEHIKDSISNLIKKNILNKISFLIKP